MSDLEATCRYAAGLPHGGIRALTDRDRAWVERKLRWFLLRTLFALLGLTAVLSRALLVADNNPWLAELLHGSVGTAFVTLGAVGVLTGLGTPGWWRRIVLVGLGLLALAFVGYRWLPALALPRWLVAEVLVITIVLGFSRLVLRSAHRIRMLLRVPGLYLDLDAGVVERFETGAPHGPLGQVLARLRDAGYVDHHAVMRLELLPRSGLVLRLGGRRINRWEMVQVIDVAPTPPHALRIDLPREVAPAQPDPRVCLQRRSLTAQERAELERHIARLRHRWWPLAVLGGIAVLGVVAWELRFNTSHDALPLDGATLGWLVILGLMCVSHVRRELAARKLEHDSRLRWVVTVHQDTADPDCDPPSLEVLPISQLAWTEQAAPAGWRLSRL